MTKKFIQHKTSEKNPDTVGLYDTDGGTLYYTGNHIWTNKTNIIRRHPNYWYQSATQKPTEVITAKEVEAFLLKHIVLIDAPRMITGIPTRQLVPISKELVALFFADKSKSDSNEWKDALGFNTAWPLQDVLKTLSQATDKLLHRYNYDGHYHEEYRICVNRAQEIINNILNKEEK